MAVWIAAALVISVLQIFGISFGSTISMAFGLLILVFAIMAHIHIQDHKLKIKSVASILIYVSCSFDLIATIVLLVAWQSQNISEIGISGLIAMSEIVIKIVAGVFAFLTACKLKKQHPTLIQDYMNLKNQKKTKA